MLKRFTTGVAALTALGALALGGSVIASAKPSHKAHHATRITHGVARAASDNPAETPSSQPDPAGGADVQSGDQTSPDTGSAAAATSGSESPAEAPSSE
ncbi:MAG: hypothetical protein ACRDNK_24255, partial [Solirubrobacteraceae bacterium]